MDLAHRLGQRRLGRGQAGLTLGLLEHVGGRALELEDQLLEVLVAVAREAREGLLQSPAGCTWSSGRCRPGLGDGPLEQAARLGREAVGVQAWRGAGRDRTRTGRSGRRAGPTARGSVPLPVALRSSWPSQPPAGVVLLLMVGGFFPLGLQWCDGGVDHGPAVIRESRSSGVGHGSPSCVIVRACRTVPRPHSGLRGWTTWSPMRKTWLWLISGSRADHGYMHRVQPVGQNLAMLIPSTRRYNRIGPSEP